MDLKLMELIGGLARKGTAAAQNGSPEAAAAYLDAAEDVKAILRATSVAAPALLGETPYHAYLRSLKQAPPR